MKPRTATAADPILVVVPDAFAGGDDEVHIVNDVRRLGALVPGLELVATADDTVIGHSASPVRMHADEVDVDERFVCRHLVAQFPDLVPHSSPGAGHGAQPAAELGISGLLVRRARDCQSQLCWVRSGADRPGATSGRGGLGGHLRVTEFDELAEHYDETRGGEQRGDEYAADIDAQLPAGEGPILEIGVGTGVVALGP